jgi:hypothetical protein
MRWWDRVQESCEDRRELLRGWTKAAEQRGLKAALADGIRRAVEQYRLDQRDASAAHADEAECFDSRKDPSAQVRGKAEHLSGHPSGSMLSAEVPPEARQPCRPGASTPRRATSAAPVHYNAAQQCVVGAAPVHTTQPARVQAAAALLLLEAARLYYSTLAPSSNRSGTTAPAALGHAPRKRWPRGTPP